MFFSEKIFSFDAGLPFQEISREVLNSINSKILGSGKIFFEKNTQFFSSVTAINEPILLGAYSYQNDGGYVRENSIIGRYCSIGRRVSIGAMSHEIFGVSTSPTLRRGSASRKYNREESLYLGVNAYPKSTKVIIGHDVWIGDGAIILSGCNIGQGSVIAANAVVRTNVEPYSIVAGVPAKIIKKRFPLEIIEKLLSLDIYECDNDFLKSTPLDNIFEFIDVFQNHSKILVDLPTYKLI